MDRKFGNHEFFQNIDAGEGFRPLNSRNSLAGAISMPAFCFRVCLSVVVAVTVLQVYLCVGSVVGQSFRWHVRFVSIVVDVECICVG